MSRHSFNAARNAAHKAFIGIKTAMKQLRVARTFRTIAHVDRCLITLFATIHKHASQLTNVLKEECYTLEGECCALYEQTYKRVLLTALNTCIKNVSRLERELQRVSETYASDTYNAIIARFYKIYRATKNDDQAIDLEYQFTRVCAYFEMERERLMDM